MPYPRYIPQYASTPNASLSAGMFTDPSQLHVDARNLSDAGQYGIAAPTVPSGYDHTWDNGYGQPQVQYSDPMQRAAQYRTAAQSDTPTTDRDALLNLRRLTEAGLGQDINQGKTRYEVFAGQPQNLTRLAPEIQRDYAATYGLAPDAEAKSQYARLKMAEEMRQMRAKPIEEKQRHYQAVAKELGYNLEDAYRAFAALPKEKQTEGTIIQMPSKFDNMGMEIKGRQMAMDSRTLRMLKQLHEDVFSGVDDGGLPAAADPQDAARQRWQQLEAQAKSEEAAAMAARRGPQNFTRYPGPYQR